MRERASVDHNVNHDSRNDCVAANYHDADHEHALLIGVFPRDEKRARDRVPLFLLRLSRFFRRSRLGALDFLFFFGLAYYWRDRLQFFAGAKAH